MSLSWVVGPRAWLPGGKCLSFLSLALTLLATLSEPEPQLSIEGVGGPSRDPFVNSSRESWWWEGQAASPASLPLGQLLRYMCSTA